MNNLPAVNEDDHMIAAARDDVGYGRIMTFNKGEYLLEKKEVPLGTEVRFHRREWTKVWIRFNPKPVQQMIYRVASGQVMPPRESLGDLDREKWDLFNGQPNDPWVKQYYVPMDILSSGDQVTFRTNSSSGRRSVSQLCMVAANRSKYGEPSIPIIRLGKVSFESGGFRNWKPDFIIAGWEEDVGEKRDVTIEKMDGEEPIDEVPF